VTCQRHALREAGAIDPEIPAPAPGSRRAIAVDGKTLRGSRTRDTTARHVLAAADQHTGVVLATTDVDTKTNEITRFATLLEHLDDLRGIVVTADALHYQRDHVAYLAQRGAHWILTVKGNQPSLHLQDAGDVPVPGRRAVPDVKVTVAAVTPAISPATPAAPTPGPPICTPSNRPRLRPPPRRPHPSPEPGHTSSGAASRTTSPTTPAAHETLLKQDQPTAAWPRG
jgi:hypothetical protein